MTRLGSLLPTRLSAGEKRFLDLVRQVMETYFGNDIRRIAHAHDVTRHALNLLQYIDANPLLTLSACYLHDIGIPEAERKYGQCSGKLQEQEGPPVARQLLATIPADEELNIRVCELVGLHHTPAGLDTPEFRILWDADALVNLAEVVAGKQPHEIEKIIDRSLVTEPGHRMACEIYLQSRVEPCPHSAVDSGK